MNIHPFIVHFPIALLTLYAICELIRFKKVTAQHFWFHIKAILVIIGFASMEIAIISGEIVQNMFKEENLDKHAIVPVHAGFAGATSVIFLILAFSYLISWIERDTSKTFLEKNAQVKKIWGYALKTANWILDTKASLILASVGIVGITIAGALGAAMVHGADVDPFVFFIHSLFF